MLLALFLSFSLASPLAASSLADATISGVVRDASGAVVPGASVVLRIGGGGNAGGGAGLSRQTITNREGRFTFDRVPEGDGGDPGVAGGATIVVRLGGFNEARQMLTAGQTEVEITLSQATLMETVLVTPERGPAQLGGVPASVNVIDRQQVRRSPAVVADDLLRQVPTFSLFRRASSLAAHPTSQGVSLRNIGPSGVSRTLVLVDNVPFNDPFGGWVYWTRVPLEAVDRIEIVNGSTSSLYGNYAMGGVINIISSRPERRTVEIRPQFGGLGTRKVDFSGSDIWGKLGVVVSGSAFDTDGFANVRADERGPVDTKTSTEFANFNVKLDYQINSRASAFFRGGYFSEDRRNGKVATADGTPVGTPNGIPEQNDTRWKSAAGGVHLLLPDDSNLDVTVFTDFERFHSNFLAVPDPVARDTARQTLDQHVPTTSVGGMVQWGRPFFTKHYVTAGSDWRWTDGDSEETSFDFVTGTKPTLSRVAGGTQRSLGVFLQDVFTPRPDLTLTASARVDNWRNYDAHNLETTVATGLPAAGNVPNLSARSDTVLSPRFAALYRLTPRVSVWGDMSWGFRAPTLNELYRQFRQGSNLTLANPRLGPERLVGGELGVSTELRPNLIIRTTAFDNRVRNAVSNVTISTTSSLTTRQRQNLGRTRIRGIQTDVDYRLSSSWRLSGGYLYNRATVTENQEDPDLVGLFLAQVPAHRASAQVAYSNARLVNAAVGIQFIGRQFDDDLNQAKIGGATEPGLPKFAVVDLTVSRRVVRDVEVFLSVQNLFDEEYYVATRPTLIGSPRLVLGGLRLGWSDR